MVALTTASACALSSVLYPGGGAHTRSAVHPAPAMHASRLLRRGLQQQSLCGQSLAAPVVAGRQQLRCMASRSPQDRSWGDLLSDAADLGRGVVEKIGDSLKDAAGAIVPDKQDDRSVRQARPVERANPQDQMQQAIRESFGGGLTGRLLGGIFKRTLGASTDVIFQEMAEAQQLQPRVAAAIEGSSEVQRRLGGRVQVGDATSISSNTTSINGRKTKSTQLRFLVEGPSDMAEAVVDVEDGNISEISIQFQNGERIPVVPGGGPDDYGSSGRIIDVEAEDVRR